MNNTLKPNQEGANPRSTAKWLKAILILAACSPILPSYAQLERSNWSTSASNGEQTVRAIDGSIESRWTTRTKQQPGQTFTVDMQESISVDRISMITKSGTASNNDEPRSYEVHVSQDGANWGTPVAIGNGVQSGTTEINFDAQSARYIRFTQTGSTTFNWWSIHDLNIFAVGDEPIDTNPGNNLPSASFTAPTPIQGATLDKGVRYDVEVNASDLDGSISNVRLFIDDKFVRQENLEPYEWNSVRDAVLNNLPVGDHQLRAETRDNLGGITSVTTSFTVTDDTNQEPDNVAPTATFVSPTPSNNSTVEQGSTIDVRVNAADADGSIDNVSLYVDNRLVGQDSQVPYEWSSTQDGSLGNLSLGSHQLRVEATDNLGAIVSVITSFLIADDGDPVDPPLTSCSVSGEQKQWHRTEVTCDGPVGDESAEATFTDNRFNVTFTKGATSITVPGHFAADGNAADTSARSGNKWRAYFSAPETGNWDYVVSFRTGEDIAVDDNLNAGTADTTIDGHGGSFAVAASGTVTRDMRTRGLLEHRQGETRMRFAGTNDVFVQGGMDSPENIFGYDEFDDTTKFSNAGSCKGILHSFDPHEQDWTAGDPTWGNNRGKSLVGLVNYIAGTGTNSAYIMMNTVNGDGCDAHPWTSYNANGNVKSFDVSKLDQWERVLGQMTAKGLLIHVMTQETENDGLLNGRNLGLERKLYYRELISRFGHHPALQWNLGEENNSSTAQLRDYTNFFKSVDPYQHPVFVHSKPRTSDREEKYEPLLGVANFDGPTIQTSNIDSSGDMYDEIRDWIARSTAAGSPWVVTLTEASGSGAPFPGRDVTANQRVYWMWASAMSGGGGFEWYLKGENQGHALDLSVENLRDFDPFWIQSGHLTQFFRDTLQRDNSVNLQDLSVDNNAINGNDDWVLSSPGKIYVAMLKKGGNASLNLQGNGSYKALWYNPRTGDTTDGEVVPSQGNLGSPPSEISQDWVVLLTETSDPNTNGLHPDIVTVLDTPLDEILRVPAGRGWADSYSVGDQCFCDTTFDHNIGPVVVDTELGRMTVRQACERLGEGPGSNGRPLYNDIQCGNGPANNAGDEDWCPGRVDIQGSDDERKLGCNQVGPKWKF